MDLEIIIQPLIEKIKQSVLLQREKDKGVELLTGVLENAKQKSRSYDLEKLLPPIYKVEDITDTFTARNNRVPSKCFMLVNSPVISSKQLREQYKCLSDLNKFQSSSDGAEVQSKTSSKVDNYGVVEKKSSGSKIRLKKSLSKSEDAVVPSKKSSTTVRAPPTISEDIQVFTSGKFFKSVEEKDGLGEIEQVGPSEAQPNFSAQQSFLDKKQEEEVKHISTSEGQESSSNQLALSDTKKKDGTLVTENTYFDQDQSDTTDEILSDIILSFGYHDLDTDLKLCLNYLCLFPKSYRGPFRRLLLLLVAEGLLNQSTEESTENGQKIENSGIPEARLCEHLAELERRNIIEVGKRKLDGSPETISMLNLIDGALSPRARRAGFFHIHSKCGQDTSKPPKVIRRFVDYGGISSGSLPNCSSFLRSYISFPVTVNNFPAFEVGIFLRDIIKAGFGLLVILDLEYVYRSWLPTHLSKLRNLKCLGLRWTFWERIPDSVGDLPCLQTLDVKHTDISTLPVNLWKAKNLQHLYLDDIFVDVDASISKAPNTHGSLTNLQTLSGLMIRNKKSVDYLIAAEMTGLRKLGVTCYEEFIEEIVRSISELTKLQSLKLRSINNSGEPSQLKFWSFGHLNELSQLYLSGTLPEIFDFGKFPPNLEVLTLSVSELSRDPMEELGRLVKLKILRLLARSYTGETMTCHPSSFTRFQVLKLWMLKGLKEWIVEDGAMPALEEVEIRRCMKLNKPSGLEKLKTLKKLVLTSMEENFVKEVKERMDGNVIIKERSWNFSSS